MPQMIFVNLPVTDIPRARAFYGAIGMSFDERFCSEDALCARLSEEVNFMLLKRAFFATFTDRAVADPKTSAAALLCISRDSRDAVDEIMEQAIAAGGTDNGKLQEMGDYMYGRSFSDPDGNIFEPMWMDVDKAMQAWAAHPPA